MTHSAGSPFPRYDHLTYVDFLHDHLIPNKPLLLSQSCTSHWRARIEWCQSTSEPNLSALRKYAHHVVPVANTSVREYSEFERDERPFGEVLDLWERGEGKGLYIKDWHILDLTDGEGRGVGEVYEVPEIFRDDWMNPPRSPTHITRPEDRGDFRFCYLGPAGTFTPLHRDVYASYSWSANIVGRKMWWSFPPNTLHRVKDSEGEMVFDVRDLPDEGEGIKVLQEEGEVIFVPSGWYHQVVNLDFCISINHNFASSPTLPQLYTALEQAQIRVEDSIADVKEMIQKRLGTQGIEWEKDWCEEVQGLLERDAGWGWRGFWEMVRDNMRSPPAEEGVRPSSEMTRGWVREVVDRYRRRRELVMLQDVREVVEEVGRLLGTKANYGTNG